MGIKITDLSADTTLSDDDLVLKVEDPGGTPVTKKLTVANFWSWLIAKAGTFSNKTISASDNTITDASIASDDILKSNGTKFVRFAKGAVNTVLGVDGGGTLGYAGVSVAQGGTGVGSISANAVVLGNGTAAVQTVAPGTSGNLLTSNGTTWVSQAAPSGVIAGTYASRPAAGQSGRIYTATDGATRWVDDGTEWRPLIPNAVPGKQPPAAAGFTLVQASGLSNAATFADQAGTLTLTWSGSGSAGAAEPVRFAYKSAPSSGATGYRITAHFKFVNPTQSGTGAALLCGIGFRNSASGSIELLEVGVIAGVVRLSRRRYTASNTGISPTFTFSAQVIGTADGPAADGIWVRVERTLAGNRAFYVSTDNVNWRQWTTASSSANDFITPDNVFIEGCIFSDAAVSTTGGVIVDSYEEVAY